MPLDLRLIGLARQGALHLAISVGLGLFAAGLAIAQAGLLADAISRAFQGGAGLAALGAALGWLALVLAARALVAWAFESNAHRASAAVKSTLRQQVLAQAVRQAPRPAHGLGTAEIVALATRGVDALDGYFTRYLPQVVLAAIVPLAVVASLLSADLVAAITVALTIPVILVFMVLAGRAASGQRRRRWDALARLAHHFLDVVEGLTTLKVFGRARAQSSALDRVTDDYRRETMAALRVAFLSAFALEFFATLSVALVAVGIGLRLVDGSLDLRTGLFVLILAPEAYLPLRQLGLHFHASEEGRAAARAAFELIDAPARATGGGRDIPDLRSGVLRVEGLAITQPGRDLFAPFGASFEIRPGEIVAISGPSGVGKSSLLMAILGLIPIDRGAIVATSDGASVGLEELDLAAWRRHLAWVPQVPFLASGSIAENVRLATLDASPERVLEALADVGLADVDPERPVGERGRALSSGERRRVAVARAIVRDAAILLVDEPTAGLDEASERLVLAAIEREARERGAMVLLVAHRPAAIAIADREVRLASRSFDGAPAGARADASLAASIAPTT